MDMYNKFQSPLGYQTGEGQIDTYGVDHSGFSARDELEYQFARQDKENQLIQNYNNQGITKNYPQQGTNFWGNPDNNYGFGSSNIHNNIENRNNNPFENTVNTFGQNQTEQSYGLGQSDNNQVSFLQQRYGLGNENQQQAKANNIPRYWDTAADGEKVWNYVQQQEGNVSPQSQNMFRYGASGIIGGVKTLYNYLTMQPKSYTDKYKHAVINCSASQSGEGGYDLANAFSNFKEDRDISSGGNTIDSSHADQYANKIGRLLGTKYPNGECDELVQRYINKRW